MILTKKGSTSSNFHLLMMIAAILLATRIVILIVESTIPQNKNNTVAWHEIPDVDSDHMKEYYGQREDKKKEKEEKEKSKDSKTDKEQIKEPKNSDNSSNKKSKKEKRKSKGKVLLFKKLLKDNTEDKPLFIFITNETNLLCKDFGKVVLTNQELVKLIESKFYPIKISLNKTLSESEYAIYRSSYVTTFIPGMIVKDCTGKDVDRLVGATDSIGLSAFLNGALEKIEKGKRKPSLDKYRKFDPHNILNRGG